MINLHSKTALVSGASRGIGKAIAVRLAECGARVIGTATSQAGVAAINDTLGKQGFGLVYQAGQPQAEEALFAEVTRRQAEPLILINNAGITSDNLLLRMSDEEWDRVIATNLTSVMRMIRQSLKPMTKARFGRIINISSVVASLGNPGQANYAASKGGVEAMTRALARELASRQITVNAVAPGYVATDMTGRISKEHAQALLEAIPLKRMAQTDDIAAGAVFLASDAAAYITGHTLHINGGMLMA